MRNGVTAMKFIGKRPPPKALSTNAKTATADAATSTRQTARA